MSNTPKKRTYSWLCYLTLLLAFCISCTNHNSSIQKENGSKNNKPITPKPIIATTSKLTFTTGIRSILEDSKGNYWFGSHQEGVCFFDGKSFTYFTVADGLCGHQIRTIQEDSKGNIWFGTDSGICSYDGEKFKTHSSKNFNDNVKNDFYSIQKESEGTWAKTEHDLWFNGGNGTGVYRFDGQQFNYLAFPIEGGNNPNNPHLVTGFANGKNNRIWIATYAGVFGHDGNSFTILNEENLKNINGQLHIRSIFEDSKGNLWIGNNGIGVLLHNENGIVNFTEKNGLGYNRIPANNLANNNAKLQHVFSIAEDKDGNVWFGDRDTGAWIYNGKSFNNYSIKDGLTSNFIWVIYQDKKDELLFGLADGSVCVFNGKSFERKY